MSFQDRSKTYCFKQTHCFNACSKHTMTHCSKQYQCRPYDTLFWTVQVSVFICCILMTMENYKQWKMTDNGEWQKMESDRQWGTIMCNYKQWWITNKWGMTDKWAITTNGQWQIMRNYRQWWICEWQTMGNGSEWQVTNNCKLQIDKEYWYRMDDDRQLCSLVTYVWLGFLHNGLLFLFHR